MTTTTSQSIHDRLISRRAKGQIALLPFVPAGYPDMPTFQRVLPALSESGADVIEIGIPFSDPIADGPVIQDAFLQVLNAKTTVAQIMAAVKEVKDQVTAPLVAMVSYSIVYRYGLNRFLADAKGAGFSGLLLPDVPPPEAESVVGQVHAAGLESILLVAPSSTPERRKEICRLSSGFVYYLSVAGITGERQSLPADLEKNLADLRKISDSPLCVGFGISRPEHVKQLAGHADGAIVGSAFVRRMQQASSGGADAIIDSVKGYCKELLSMVR